MVYQTRIEHFRNYNQILKKPMTHRLFLNVLEMQMKPFETCTKHRPFNYFQGESLDNSFPVSGLSFSSELCSNKLFTYLELNIYWEFFYSRLIIKNNFLLKFIILILFYLGYLNKVF